ncbi:MAG: hypothetical protein ACFFER_07720 [Candidatus Thorarchaeota archaeon]
MQLRILGCSPTNIELKECVNRLDALSRVKLAGKRVQEPGLLDSATIKSELNKEVDRKGRDIRTFCTNLEKGWISFNYISKHDQDALSYDIRDTLYYADIETQRPREMVHLSRLLVIGLKPLSGHLCLLSPSGGISSSDSTELANIIGAMLPEIGNNPVELQLDDNILIDMAQDCIAKGYDVRGASIAVEDLLLNLHSRGVSLDKHPSVRSTEDELGILHKIKSGEWNSISIEIISESTPYIIYLSKAKDKWDYLTLYPLRGRERMSLDKAAAIFDSVISLVSLSLKPRPRSEEQTSVLEF